MTAIDSNVLIGLLNADDALNRDAKAALELAMSSGPMVIAAPVFLEMTAMPKHADFDLDSFLARAGIRVDWKIDESVWRLAGEAYRSYVGRRRSVFKLPRRIAADFLIGAHALAGGYALLTFDRRTFRSAFPELKLAPRNG